MRVTQLKALRISEIWYGLLVNAIEHGRVYEVSNGPNKGRKRLELDMVHLQITKPEDGFEEFIETRKLSADYFKRYVRWIRSRGKTNMNFRDAVFDYRLLSSINLIKQKLDLSIDLTPIGLLIQMYKQHGFKTNRACLEIANVQDIAVNPSPCFRVLDTKVIDNKLNLIVYVRSWDLFGEMPGDLAVIEELKRYIASEIGVQSGEIIASAKGVHIYEKNWKEVEELVGKRIEFKL